jgi:hypothetical protein
MQGENNGVYKRETQISEKQNSMCVPPKDHEEFEEQGGWLDSPLSKRGNLWPNA